ncbi:hypothetical protein GFS60_04799 [Rhodococcus sp. WAY2]|nr:hypothetical protein GFS60_04799 [Rhodococcus sp. WAY2]
MQDGCGSDTQSSDESQDGSGRAPSTRPVGIRLLDRGGSSAASRRRNTFGLSSGNTFGLRPGAFSGTS